LASCPPSPIAFFSYSLPGGSSREPSPEGINELIGPLGHLFALIGRALLLPSPMPCTRVRLGNQRKRRIVAAPSERRPIYHPEDQGVASRLPSRCQRHNRTEACGCFGRGHRGNAGGSTAVAFRPSEQSPNNHASTNTFTQRTCRPVTLPLGAFRRYLKIANALGVRVGELFGPVPMYIKTIAERVRHTPLAPSCRRRVCALD